VGAVGSRRYKTKREEENKTGKRKIKGKRKTNLKKCTGKKTK
jgi:hypothetical protein